MSISFNPCRVFSGLATWRSGAMWRRGSFSFNPCRVFSGLATRCSLFRSSKLTEFQSLSGFFRPCNLAGGHDNGDHRMFQSLSGFFRPCNVSRPHRPRRRDLCFNPCRVFSGLATLTGCRHDVIDLFVSIPVGFFQALQLMRDMADAKPHIVFQSLSGFFRPCNLMTP